MDRDSKPVGMTVSFTRPWIVFYTLAIFACGALVGLTL